MTLAAQRSVHRAPLKSINKAFDASLRKKSNLQLANKSSNWVEDLEKLKLAISDRHESAMYTHAVLEYKMAQVALNSCMYRFAFAGLRFFYEQIIFAIQFSAREIEYREWMNGGRDLVWQQAVDEETGIFSSSFCSAFGPEFKDERKTYLQLARTAYRECSEYVHNNASKHASIKSPLNFEQSTFEAWHDLAESIHMVLLFSWAVRYLAFLEKTEKNNLEQIFLEAFPQMPGIKNHFS